MLFPFVSHATSDLFNAMPGSVLWSAVFVLRAGAAASVFRCAAQQSLCKQTVLWRRRQLRSPALRAVDGRSGRGVCDALIASAAFACASRPLDRRWAVRRRRHALGGRLRLCAAGGHRAVGRRAPPARRIGTTLRSVLCGPVRIIPDSARRMHCVIDTARVSAVRVTTMVRGRRVGSVVRASRRRHGRPPVCTG